MITLIYGPNGSGKSRYAESLFADMNGERRLYIATMIPYGEDGINRVERHIKMREGLGFITMEDPYLDMEYNIAGCDILLEDVSNYVANSFFGRSMDIEPIMEKLTALSMQADNCVMVTIGGLTSTEYEDETREYIDLLNEVNRRLKVLANRCVSMEAGKAKED